MINKILTFILLLCVSTTSLAGITIVGTRFIIDNEKKSINIKIINDNENDYLIKSNISDNNFIVSPPLFMLPKNSSNIVTIIPTDVINSNQDSLLDLTITAIPKSEVNNGNSNISLAVRSHFKVIYRHNKLTENEYSKLKIIRYNNDFYLENKSNFVFTISTSINENYKNEKIKNISPAQKIILDNCSAMDKCNIWVNIYNDYNDVIKKINLSYN
ncbi:molecular chaperone [Providencia burhodogranariea]|uniref:Pili assembly chaperone, N-terminal protein n=1 Tax=Providencia burhodogranariea DSM 19968 TaxID=1141662 RepID=K8WIJ5_9GAMM|nr:fimbria/pilus periplasmic chaperone [Providencia burhodogranariea]EKT56050.1 Pili assembly chaperone, N-terminal protein [Providencia burhodogranariea DSM 19968]